MLRTVVALSVFLAATLAAQSPSSELTIRGLVISAEGVPLRRARVSVSTGPHAPLSETPQLFTNEDGRFTARLPVADSYTITASKSGYEISRLILRRTTPQADAQLRLRRAAVISGHVTDETGTAAVEQQVTARRLDVPDREQPIGARLDVPASAATRRAGLPPGRYLVMATADADVSRDDGVGYAPVYYPGTSQIEFARPVSLESGDVAGIDFTAAPSVTARITGTVVDSAGGQLSFATVRLVAAHSTRGVVLESLHAAGLPRKDFIFRDVPPGDYVVQASGERVIGRPQEFGITYVTVVDRDPPPLVVQTSPGVTLEGHFVVDGSEPLPSLTAAVVPLNPDRIPVGATERSLAVSSTGAFYGTGLSGPTAIALRGAPENWFIKSILIAGVDVTDGAFDFGADAGTISGAEVVLSPDGASVSGRVTGDRGPDVRTVVIFPTIRDYWSRHSRRLKAAPVNADGSFRIAGMPAGHYWVAALAGVDPSIDEWQSADVLEPLVPGAVDITLADGEARQVHVR